MEGIDFVDNVFDKIGETALPVAIAADLPTTRRIAVNTPRTVGVTFDYRFLIQQIAEAPREPTYLTSGSRPPL